MTVIENQTTVACTPEELFDYCVDIRNELEWNPTAKSMEKLTDGPVGVRQGRATSLPSSVSMPSFPCRPT